MFRTGDASMNQVTELVNIGLAGIDNQISSA